MMQYIGQTKNPLHCRINLHRSNIKNYKQHLNNNHDNIIFNAEFEHFQKHSFENVEIEILAINPKTEERLCYENQYILQHNTIYPYGLNQIVNNKIQFNENINNKQTVYSILNFNNITKTTRTRKGYNKNKNKVTNTTYKIDILNLQQEYNKNYN
jgi:hypothetical protein